MTTIVEHYKRHQLPAEQFPAALELVLALLAAQQAGRPAQLVFGRRTIDLPPAVQEAALDAVSMLVSRSRVALVAVDDTRKVKLTEASEILDCHYGNLRKRLRALGITPSDARRNAFDLAEIIEAHRGSRPLNQG